MRTFIVGDKLGARRPGAHDKKTERDMIEPDAWAGKGADASRRDFLKTGACAALVAATGLPGPVARAATPLPLPLAMAIYDRRFPAGQVFARQALGQVAELRGIEGPVHELWFHHLRPAWQVQPTAIAGLTTYDSLFLLALMAQDVRMRVIYRAHHLVNEARGGTTHVAFGPRDALARQPAFEGDEAQWGRTAARIVTGWPGAMVATDGAGSTIAEADRHVIPRQTLVTWVLAPAPRSSMPLA